MSATATKLRRALVLAGGAAKGAFEAGAIAALAERGIEFDTVVGTSAGALNGAFFATAIRAGDERGGAAELVRFWIQQGHWQTFLDVSLRDVLGARGLSRSHRIERVLLERMAARALADAKREVQLRMITAVLSVEPGQEGAITSEYVFSFASADFARRLHKIAQAAVASAAFPGLIAPVHVPGLGYCADGGLTANTPLAEALQGGADEVYVVTPWSSDTTSRRVAGGELVGRWVEILVDERFNRELARAERAHEQLRALANLRDRGVLTEWHYRQVRQALDLAKPPANIVLIRPEQALPGGLLAAFGDEALRVEYVARGRAAAEQALMRQGRSMTIRLPN